MALQEHDYIRNIGILAGGLTAPPKNAPGEYSSRKRQYLGAESTAFAKQYAKYSTDYFSAEAQGLDRSDPAAWQTVSMRMADVINPSASMTRYIDDYKMILIGDEAIDYVPLGTKFVTMGSTWLAVNPENISSAYGTGIIRRCNAVWNHLDYYGNVLSEPLAIERTIANASTPDAQDHLLVATGYYNVKCQYNEYTAQLNDNSRIILGSSAYRLSGFTDFIQEFTGDYSSVRLAEFTARYEEPNREIDDMENHVAGGLEFSWEIAISGKGKTNIGIPIVLTASSARNGEAVESTQEHPISYLWESSDEGIASIDADGNITPVSAGTCRITCRLEQNPGIEETVTIEVVSVPADTTVAFDGSVPETLGTTQTAEITASVFLRGVASNMPVIWEFSGADEASYSAEVNGNTVVITCWGASETPLTVTAKYLSYAAETQIALEGI